MKELPAPISYAILNKGVHAEGVKRGFSGFPTIVVRVVSYTNRSSAEFREKQIQKQRTMRKGLKRTAGRRIKTLNSFLLNSRRCNIYTVTVFRF